MKSNFEYISGKNIPQLFALAAVFSISLFILSCQNPTSNPDTITIYSFSDLPDYLQNNSQVIIDDDDYFDGSMWNDPHVLFENNEFIMYASSRSGSDESPVHIYRLTSTDGSTFSLDPPEPVLSPRTNETVWDSDSVETPAVVYFNAQYHLFYTGYDNGHEDSTSYKIGQAVSDDGVNFTRVSEPVVMEPSDPGGVPVVDYKQFVTAEPAPIVFNNKIYLYFTALGYQTEVSATWQTIGLITSSDGSTWEESGQVVTPNLSLYPRNTYLGYSTPHAMVYDNQVHLFVDVVNETPWC